MNCPNCQTLCGEHDHFCYLCGTALQPPKPKKGSRLIPLLLLILMSAVGLILFFATASSTPVRADGSTPWFYVRDGALYFEEHRYTGGSELTVPSQIAGQTVFELSAECFADCTELTTIILPDTLQAIHSGAFSSCTSLRGIAIPESVSMIGAEAFSGCTGLEAIRICSNIRAIGADAFDDCSYLAYIYFDGTYAEWMSLYDEFINPYAGIFCEDGSFYQGGDPYE